MVDAFLKEHPDFQLMPVNQAVAESSCDGVSFDGCECQNLRFTRRFYPHKTRGEGQFAAVLKHTGEKAP